MPSYSIELIVRAVVVDRNKLLLCESMKGKHYFLPGGHVEFGEGLKGALIREIKEELGVSGTIGDMIGVLENTYKEEDLVHHEVNVIFSVSLPITKIISQESHITFHWVKFRSLSDINMLPEKLSDFIIKWMKDKETFFESTFRLKLK